MSPQPAPMRSLAVLTIGGGGGDGAGAFPFLPADAARQLVGRALQQAGAARRLFTRLVVSTADPEILGLAAAHRVEAPFRRPAELAAAPTPPARILQHAVEWLERADGQPFDWICWLQPSTPLCELADLEAGLALALRGGADSVTAVGPVEPDLASRLLRVDGERAAPFFRGPDGKAPDFQAFPPAYRRNDAFTLVRRGVLGQSSLWGTVVVPAPMPAERGLVVRDLIDFERARARLTPAQWPGFALPAAAAAPPAGPPLTAPAVAPGNPFAGLPRLEVAKILGPPAPRPPGKLGTFAAALFSRSAGPGVLAGYALLIAMPGLLRLRDLPGRELERGQILESRPLAGVLCLLMLLLLPLAISRRVRSLGRSPGSAGLRRAFSSGPLPIPFAIFWILLALAYGAAFCTVRELGHFLWQSAPAFHPLWAAGAALPAYLVWPLLALLLRIFEVQTNPGLLAAELAARAEPAVPA